PRPRRPADQRHRPGHRRRHGADRPLGDQPGQAGPPRPAVADRAPLPWSRLGLSEPASPGHGSGPAAGVTQKISSSARAEGAAVRLERGSGPAVTFGLFDWVDADGVREPGQLYRERLDLLGDAESQGFDIYHLAEHHGTPLGLVPSPSVFLAAAAVRTT